ncbi:MAG: YARHG domain-containing protein [Bacteroidota bacterium]
MKTPLALIAVIAFSSCTSKQDQQQSTNDTTAVTPVESTSSVSEKPIQLTPEMIQSINAQLFLAIHQQQMKYEPILLATVEEFTTDGTNFEYKLIRDNMTMGGWHYPSEFAVGSDETSDESSEEESGGDAGPEYSEGTYAEAEQQFFNNQVDTINMKGSYEAYAYDANNVRVRTTGYAVYENEATVEDNGDVTITTRTRDIGDFIIESRPPIFYRDQMYLKAKIMLLTDSDLLGLSKDDLAYLRNEIFARHGHTFKTPKMMNYFNNQKWYHPNVDDAASLLNKFEKQNVEFIQEQGRKVRRALIIFTTQYKEGGERFKLVAQTLAKEKIANGLEVILEPTETKADVKAVFNKLADENKFIDEFHFVGHSGMYGPMFGTIKYPEQFSPHEVKILRIPFAEKAEAYFHCCRSARWFAPYFSRVQHVTTYGYHWYTAFSRAPDRYRMVLSHEKLPELYCFGCPGKKSHGLFASLKKYTGTMKAERFRKFEDQRGPVDTSYNPVAELYDETFKDIRVRRDELDWINKHLPDLAGKSVVDIGCGNGALLRELSPRIHAGVGVDVSSQLIGLAQRHGSPRTTSSTMWSMGPLSLSKTTQ